MYVRTCSALIAPEPCEHARWKLGSGGQGKRFGQVRHVTLPACQIARCPEPIEWVRRQWREHGDGTTAIGDLDALPGLDSSQQFASSLSEFPHANAGHVLFVAHSRERAHASSSARHAGLTR